jgi:hypothetical protein
MQLVETTISRADLHTLVEGMFGNLVKAVVDVEQGLLVVDAELHADEEAFLLERGSKQEHLWGINLYPELEGPDFIEFDSMINIKPRLGNRTRSVDDPAIQTQIRAIVALKVSE